ncbi:MAG: phosphoserine phosphatase SerB [Piscirickettsiaceae bacterium]|nr:phosphoserine phosphatase SerB [Piscirickettsiaceae bacterium]
MRQMVLQGSNLTIHAAKDIAVKLQGTVKINNDYAVVELFRITASNLQMIRSNFDFDINVIPIIFEPKETKLLVMDMDSTLINIECINEIAGFVNLKLQVSNITKAAMRGEIDFQTSLRQRVSLLKGVDVNVLKRVYLERLQLNIGSKIMLKRLRQRNIKTALVSGGFTFFTDRLKRQLGLDFSMANTLGEYNGRLTGEVIGDICDAQTKADLLLEYCDKLDIHPRQAVAIGDGSNDLLMMNEAGMGVAYHAESIVQQKANTAINYCGLEGILGLLQFQI